MAIALAACVFVVAGYDPLEHYTPEVAAWLRRLDQFGATLGAVDTGCFVLAECGLLDREPVTLHWEAIPAFQESYPGLQVTQELFEIGRRITCAGGTASLDMMLNLIGREHGSELADRVPAGKAGHGLRPGCGRWRRATASTTSGSCRCSASWKTTFPTR